MAVIGVKAFGGMRPFVQPRLLPETDSQLAIDVLLDSGAIRPMMGTTTLKSLTSANSTVRTPTRPRRGVRRAGPPKDGTTAASSACPMCDPK